MTTDMRWVEAEGESIDAAIEAALVSLGVTRDRVEVEILSNAARGLFGLGGRKARVRATLRQSITEQFLREADEPDDSVEQAAAAPAVDRRRRTESERSERRPREPILARDERIATPPDAAVAQSAGEVLRTIVGHIGVSADVQARVDEDSVVLDLAGDASGVLIGRKGQMLDALEYLVSRIVSRDQTSAVHVVIDCERYRERRREALQELARRMAEEAKRKRRAVKLNAMNPRDRRIVHLILQQDASITTRSSGKGHFRKLIIIPRGTGGPAAE
jgi:spoIIIJ-associated protein